MLKSAIRLLVVVGLTLTVAIRAAPLLAASDYCAPSESPEFRFGFAFLRSQLGETMGEPVECEHGNPDNGDSLQNTTTGLAFYRSYTNTPTFTDGWNHWGWTSAGLVYWEGSSIDPPGVIVPTPIPADVQQLIDFLAGYQSQVPRMDEILPVLAGMEGGRITYDTLPPNILGHHWNGWITLNTDLLQSESLEVAAVVLAHEGHHALDDILGLLGPGQACYDSEVRGFTVQALLWSSIYGIDGKTPPLTDLEGWLNGILYLFLHFPLTLVDTIIATYGEQCG